MGAWLMRRPTAHSLVPLSWLAAPTTCVVLRSTMVAVTEPGAAVMKSFFTEDVVRARSFPHYTDALAKESPFALA